MRLVVRAIVISTNKSSFTTRFHMGTDCVGSSATRVVNEVKIMNATISHAVASKRSRFGSSENSQVTTVITAVIRASGITSGKPHTSSCGLMNEIHEYSRTPT